MNSEVKIDSALATETHKLKQQTKRKHILKRHQSENYDLKK